MSEQDRQWQLLRQGKREALGYLFKYFYNDLYQYALTMLSEPSNAQDHLQQCFLKLWEKRSSLPSSVNVKAYLLQSLRFSVIDQIRRDKTSSKKLLDFYIINQIKGDAQENASSLKLEKLKEALQQLSSVQKEIIYLRFYNQVPYTEIAEIIGMKYQSVRNAAHRAIKKLRVYLHSEK